MPNEQQSNSLTSPEEQGLTFSDLWSMFWDHKIWYFIALAVALFLAVLFLYRTPKEYSATAQVMIDESTQAATMKTLGLDAMGIMDMRSSKSIENELVAFSSPDLLAQVVERLGLQTRYYQHQFLRTVELYGTSPIGMVRGDDAINVGFSIDLEKVSDAELRLKRMRAAGKEMDLDLVAHVGDTVSTPLGSLAFIATDKDLSEMEHDMTVSWTPSIYAARVFKTNLSASLSGKESSVIVLSLNDGFPRRAELILKTLIDVYNEVWISNKNRANSNTSSFIDARLVGLENELSVVETALKDYKESHNLTDLQAIAQMNLEESSAYSAKTFEVSNRLSVAKYIKDYLEDPANALALIPSNLGLGKDSVDGQITEYNNLLLQRERLLAGSSANNPLVVDLRNTLTSLRGAILRSIDNLINSLQMQMEKLEGKEEQLMTKMSKSTGQELEILSIERNQKIKEQLYIFLLQKREENDMAALVNVGNTRVLMVPFCSNVPVAPRSMMILLVAIVLGLGLPFGVIFLITIMDTRIKNRQDLADMKAPFLAELPHIGKPVPWIRRHLCMDRMANDDTSNRSRILVEPGKRDALNEAFRVLRTNTDMMLGRKGEEGKVVMMASFLPNMGKSVVGVNLAASMALKNDKVLLIDLDMRKATLSKALELNHSGVAAYLNGKAEDWRRLTDEIAPFLHVLPVGSLPPNPSELLVSERFEQLLKEARREYDYVFLDCPPVDIVADSGIITNFTDMTIFVVRSLQMNKSVVPVLDQLYEAKIYRRMAVILNDVQYKYSGYGYGRYGGYGYGKGYGYGYGYGEEERTSSRRANLDRVKKLFRRG